MVLYRIIPFVGVGLAASSPTGNVVAPVELKVPFWLASIVSAAAPPVTNARALAADLYIPVSGSVVKANDGKDTVPSPANIAVVVVLPAVHTCCNVSLNDPAGRVPFLIVLSSASLNHIVSAAATVAALAANIALSAPA